MTEERKQLLNKAIELYTTTNTNLVELSKNLGIPKSAIRKYFRENNVEIHVIQGARPKLKKALEQYPEKSLKEISEQSGILIEVLELALSEKNKSKLKKLLISLSMKEYLNTPELDRSLGTISDKYGLNRKTLQKYLIENGYEISQTGAACHFSYDKFDVINTEEKAYWLGFMYADGYVNTIGNKFGINVALKDISHLEKFNQFLNYPKGLNISKSHQFGTKSNLNTKGEEMYMVSTVIGNKHMRDSLISKGCVPNKSLILEFPSEEIVPKELQRHFVRGYFDGDGTLGIYPHSKTNPKLEESLMIVGTKPFLEKVQEILGMGFLIHKTNCSEFTFRLGYSTKKAVNAAKIMYDNSTIYLERKYNIYKQFCAAVKSGKNGEG